MVCVGSITFYVSRNMSIFEWAWGDIENATETECIAFNKAWGKILILVAYSIPLIVAIFAYKTSQYTAEENKKLAFLWKWLLVLDCNLFPILSILMMLDDECITVGENGHQKWPPLLTPHILE
eukprot:584960_1